MDTRSSSAKAMAWVSRVTTISMMMVLPVLAGHYLDKWLGTVALFMFLGLVFGLVCAVWLMLDLVRDLSSKSENQKLETEDKVEGDSESSEF